MPDIDLLTYIASTAPAATGSDPASVVLGVESGTLKKFPIVGSGLINSVAKAQGLITLADTRVDRLYSANPGAWTWVLPYMFKLGYTYADSSELRFSVQHRGNGNIQVNPSYNFGTVLNAGAMTALAAPAPAIGDICFRTDDSGKPYMLNALPSSVAGNWGVCNGANAPTGTIVIHDPNGLAAQYSKRYDPTITYTAIGLDEWIVE